MKGAILIVSATVLLVLGCTKQQESEPLPEREPSIPEKVEGQIVDFLSTKWQILSDTLDYFNSNMLLRGKTRGTAPDGVYYELDIDAGLKSATNISFTVADSTWVIISGSLLPLDLNIKVLGTETTIEKGQGGSTVLSVSDVKVVLPAGFLQKKDLQAPLYFEGKEVGWITWDVFENTDYSTGTYIIIHYYGDPRTFAIFDNGLDGLLRFWKGFGNVVI